MPLLDVHSRRWLSRRILWWLLCGAVMVPNVGADTLRIKGGEIVHGKIVQKTATEIVVQFDFGTMSFLPGEIEVLAIDDANPTSHSATSASEPVTVAPPTEPTAIAVPAPIPAPASDIALAPPTKKVSAPEATSLSLRDATKAVAFIAVQREDGSLAGGTGTIINDHGTMLTNHHVVDRAAKILVLLPEDRPRGRSSREPKTYEASVQKSDPYYDIALIDIHAKTPVYFRMASDDTVEVGQRVRAIGNPQGLAISVSEGIVSAVRTNHELAQQYVQLPNTSMSSREFEEITWIQTDAAVNPGNSGGPLLNDKQEIIGINSFIVSSSGGSQGLNFALHVKHLRKFARGHLK